VGECHVREKAKFCEPQVYVAFEIFLAIGFPAFACEDSAARSRSFFCHVSVSLLSQILASLIRQILVLLLLFQRETPILPSMYHPLVN